MANGKAGTVAAVPGLKVARFVSKANAQYPFLPIGSNADLAARVIGERFRLSPAIACTIAELVGYGARA
ncbi:hypothetical protein [Sphingomonas sp. LaA6.9]|uniref:hypothetical protein n=1 Tax=Sphingomonas sp. LaA6.9 TaxID=2919914 RepID=UPI001F4F1108|nr:hypothetical protein [Sphingomonas sp. LaA6.9]MCJ8158548.1 hypothetical protein [Sphingomonas sp. LaA6.9]